MDIRWLKCWSLVTAMSNDTWKIGTFFPARPCNEYRLQCFFRYHAAASRTTKYNQNEAIFSTELGKYRHVYTCIYRYVSFGCHKRRRACLGKFLANTRTTSGWSKRANGDETAKQQRLRQKNARRRPFGVWQTPWLHKHSNEIETKRSADTKTISPWSVIGEIRLKFFVYYLRRIANATGYVGLLFGLWTCVCVCVFLFIRPQWLRRTYSQ